jgi:hypothetical protein
MKEWIVFVLLAVLLVGIGSWQSRWASPTVLKEDQQAAENTKAEADTSWGPTLEQQLSSLRRDLHEADQVFVGEFLGGDGCSMADGPFRIPAHGSFIVTKVLKGFLKEGDFVSGEMIGCLPPLSELPVIVIGRWEGSASLEEKLGSVSVPFLKGQSQIHYVYITELVAYPQSIELEQRVMGILLQMLTCREAHQVFWVGQPPGTARVVVDPEQPPEGTSVSFSLCITEENFDPEVGEVEMWHYVGYNFGFQVKEGLWLSGVAIRNLFKVPAYLGASIEDVWYFAAPIAAGERSSFVLKLPRGRYEPFLSDQDVYVFSQKNPNVSTQMEGGEPVDILRGALWIPKPKGQ